MNLLRIMMLEIRHRWIGSVLGLLAIALAVCMAVFVFAVSEGTERETRRIQRDIGLNVLILPAGTDLNNYWLTGASEQEMPATLIDRVSDQAVANRLIPMLRRPIQLDGQQAMLVGIGEEEFAQGLRKKDVFSKHMPAGHVVLGNDLAASIGAGAGDSIDVLGETMTVDRVMHSTGSVEDVSAYVDLPVAQRLLGMEGRINEIQALECHCEIGEEDPLGRLQATLEPLLPGTLVVRREREADARLQQRHHAEQFVAILAPIVLVLCALWVAALAVSNIRERRVEIGILRAVGRPARSVAILLLGRWVILGIDGAIIGFFVSLLLVDLVGPSMFPATGNQLHISWWLLPIAIGLAPLCAVSASAIPAALVLSRDPSHALATA